MHPDHAPDRGKLAALEEHLEEVAERIEASGSTYHAVDPTWARYQLIEAIAEAHDAWPGSKLADWFTDQIGGALDAAAGDLAAHANLARHAAGAIASVLAAPDPNGPVSIGIALPHTCADGLEQADISTTPAHVTLWLADGWTGFALCLKCSTAHQIHVCEFMAIELMKAGCREITGAEWTEEDVIAALDLVDDGEAFGAALDAALIDWSLRR